MYPQTLLACVFVSVSPKLYGSQKVWPAAALLHESNFHEMESCQWRRGSGNAVWQSTDFKQPDRRRYITYMCVCVCTSDTRWRAAPGSGCSWLTAWAHVSVELNTSSRRWHWRVLQKHGENVKIVTSWTGQKKSYWTEQIDQIKQDTCEMIYKIIKFIFVSF